jgi:tetratricopeptide (TPR) repeat protein
LRVATVSAATLALVAALAVLAIPWTAVRQTDEGLALGPQPRAYRLFSAAASLNPFSEQPALAEAMVAARAGELGRAQRAFHAALRRNPSDWYPHFMLGILAGVQRRSGAARRQLAEAHRLSPRDLIVTYAQRRLQVGSPMTQREVAKLYRNIAASGTGARQR